MPGPIVGEWNEPSNAQTSCSCVPTIRHSTVVPIGIDSLAGMNQWSPISTRYTGAPAALVTTALGVGTATPVRDATEFGAADGEALTGRTGAQAMRATIAVTTATTTKERVRRGDPSLRIVTVFAFGTKQDGWRAKRSPARL